MKNEISDQADEFLKQTTIITLEHIALYPFPYCHTFNEPVNVGY
jgi:hypothetical protein